MISETVWIDETDMKDLRENRGLVLYLKGDAQIRICLSKPEVTTLSDDDRRALEIGRILINGLRRVVRS